MFSRRRTPLVVAAACLVLASGAAAAEGDAFTARATPSHVKPGVAASFTVTLTNDSSPSGEANGATISLPAGFAVTGQPKEPSITGCGDPRDWDIQLLSAGRIELAKHDGAANNLCPGGTLSVEFSATPTTEEGSYDWAVELFRDNETFTLHPPQPTVVVDGTAPETTIASGPPPVTNQTTAGFAFSSEPGSTFQCRLDNQPVESCTSPKTYVGLTPGPHSVLVQATDPAGNAELNPANHVWTIDLTPPTVAITGKPSEQTTRNAATFSFVASEGQTRCNVDSGPAAACGSPITYTSLADGRHTFVVSTTDAAGNTAQDSYVWSVDTTAPETTLGSRPRSRTTRSSATFTFTADEAAAFECRLDAAAFAPCASPKRYSRLRRSRHTFRVRAIDPAGNVDPAPVVYRWTIGAATRRAKASSALLGPQAGARVTSPPLLRWRRVARASYYNVQLYRGRVKLLSTWPIRTRLQLRARWTYLGRQRRLTPGTYQWYVWPGYGRPAARNYGRLLGQSTFTVIARP
jgi:hypothetical protein